MPDTPAQSSAVQITSLVLNCIQTIVIAWLTVQSNQTHEKVENVQQTQQEVKQETADAAKEIKSTLDARGEKLDKEAAEKKKEEEKQRAATASMLYGNWKFLVDNAVTAEDIKEAANAKRRYDEFTSKK